jgi:flagella basal body P-ring formation protein FlgA
MKIMRLLSLSAVLILATVLPSLAVDGFLGANDLRQIVRDYMVQTGKPIAENVAIGPLDERMQVPACANAPTIAPRSSYSSSLVVHCDAPQAWTYNLRVDFDGASSVATIPAPSKGVTNGPVQEWHVVVARASLPVGTILTASMLEERITNIAPGGAFLKSANEAIGLRLTAAMVPGVAITTRNIARAPTIMKGETVILTAEGEGFSIATPARAEEDGYEGDLVAVRNIKSGIVLSGRVGQGGIVLVR